MRDVLVWTKAPLLLRNELVLVDAVEGERQAARGEVKRLGDGPVIVACAAGSATVELAAREGHRDRLLGPHRAGSADQVAAD